MEARPGVAVSVNPLAVIVNFTLVIVRAAQKSGTSIGRVCAIAIGAVAKTAEKTWRTSQRDALSTD